MLSNRLEVGSLFLTRLINTSVIKFYCSVIKFYCSDLEDTLLIKPQHVELIKEEFETFHKDLIREISQMIISHMNIRTSLI